jgi:hypothetical protein
MAHRSSFRAVPRVTDRSVDFLGHIADRIPDTNFERVDWLAVKKEKSA